jgi:tRNA threonylcarbamoyladenosine biosynthesis protein TsaB
LLADFLNLLCDLCVLCGSILIVQLAIDSASDEPGIALAVDGVAALTLTWQTQQNHSVELLPNTERLLAEAERSKSDVEAVFVDVGPGGYAALRVGVSVAKALAHGLGVPIAGVGRLELDAFGVAANAPGRRIVALHRAGRGELAWAAYRLDGAAWPELMPPHIIKSDGLADEIRTDDVITGDIDDAIAEAAQRRGATIVAPNEHRVVALAALGHRRVADGRADDAIALVPLYLRAPAIGPQATTS